MINGQKPRLEDGPTSQVKTYLRDLIPHLRLEAGRELPRRVGVSRITFFHHSRAALVDNTGGALDELADRVPLTSL